MEEIANSIKKTLERLNKALVAAGFPKVYYNEVNKHEDIWEIVVSTFLLFDKDGKFIAPKAEELGEYGEKTIDEMCGIIKIKEP